MKMKALLITILAIFTISTKSQVVLAPNQYLIEFTDKNNSPYSIDKPTQFLSQKAIDRRKKFGIEITEQDIPVNPDYIKQVENTGVKITNVSKWYNSAVIYTENESVLSAIEALEFVKSFSKKGSSKSARKSTKKIDKFKDFNNVSNALDGNNSIYGSSYWQIALENGHVLHEYGFTGEGVDIAVIDAGFSFADEIESLDSLFSQGRMLGTKDFVYPKADDFFGEVHFHGTAVLSHMAGLWHNELVGTAPKANYWLIRSENAVSEYLVEEENMISAYEFADSVGADIATASLGYFMFDDPNMDHSYNDLNGELRLSKAADIAVSKGMVVTCAAGNEAMSNWKHIVAPSDAKNVLCVGATDALGSYAFFSSLGPAADGRVKPDVAGVGNGTVYQCDPGFIYNMGMGTSFATPIIAGLVACLWQTAPDTSNMQIIDLVRKCGSQYETPDDKLGYGIPNFKKAYLTLNPPNYSGEITSNIIWREEANIVGDISIKENGKLTILPGTKVIANGYYGITIQENGSVEAIGDANDSIVFTVQHPENFERDINNTECSWKGITFKNTTGAAEKSVFKHCKISYAKTVSTENNGSAISVIGTASNINKKISLEQCVFSNNISALNGGAIALEFANTDIVNCIFEYNQAKNTGAAIYINNANSKFLGNLVHHNQAGKAAFAILNSKVNLVNNTIVANKADSISGISLTNTEGSVSNSIVWNNKNKRNNNSQQLEISGNQPLTFLNCNFENGNNFGATVYDNCINEYPAFVDTAHINYQLQPKSPCVNKGTNAVLGGLNLLFDLNYTERIVENTVDIGCFEYGTKIMEISGNLNFGRAIIDAYNYRTIYLHNKGNSTLFITDVILPDGYTAEWMGGTISPADSQAVDIVLTPSSLSVYDGIIKFESNMETGFDTISASGYGSNPYVTMFVHNRGVPIEGAVLELGDSTTLTDAKGIIDLGYVPAGEYNYTISATNYVTIFGTFWVHSYDFDIDNELMTNGSIIFRVKVNGEGVDGAEVYFENETMTTFAGGVADFHDVLPGKYEYKVKLQGYDDYIDSVDFKGGSLGVNVELGGTNSINENNNISIKCYPNPVKNKLLIESISDEKIESVNLYNSLGMQIQSALLKSNHTCELNMGGFPKGIYYIEILNSNRKKIVRKIVKQ